MKKLLNLLVITSLFSIACSKNIQEKLDKGQYDSIISILIKKMSGKKNKDRDDVLLLEMAFAKAQERDLQIEESLRSDSSGEKWGKLNQLYKQINARQDRISPLVPLYSKDGYQASFKFINTQERLRESADNAAAHLYKRAESLIAEAEKTKDKSLAKEAVYELERLDVYARDYKNKEFLRKKAHHLGTTFYLVRVLNNTSSIMPADFEDELLRFGVEDLNERFKSYDIRKRHDISYDYDIHVNLTSLDYSPEREQIREITEEKTEAIEHIQKDAKGRPIKDTSGNVLKVVTYEHYKAVIEERVQTKAVKVRGRLEYFDNANGDIAYSKPLEVEYFFEHCSARLIHGDRKAISDENRRKLDTHPIQFPSNEAMILRATEKLKHRVKDIIENH